MAELPEVLLRVRMSAGDEAVVVARAVGTTVVKAEPQPRP